MSRLLAHLPVILCLMLLTSVVGGKTLDDCTCAWYEDGSYDPAWSPRGNYLAAISSSVDPSSYFFWSSVVAMPLASGLEYFGYGEHSPVRNPAWSPDEASLAFVTFDGLHFLDAATSMTSMVLQLEVREPAWSPDGNTIALVYQGNIWLWPVGGGPLQQVTTKGGNSPTWSPDGMRIAYEDDGLIWIRTLAEDAPRHLTAGMSPSWSASGRWIAFASVRSGNPDIWVIAPTGGTAVQITTSSEQEGDPTWAPDDRSIAYVVTQGFCSCIRTVENLPDFVIRVEELPWSAVKQLYR